MLKTCGKNRTVKLRTNERASSIKAAFRIIIGFMKTSQTMISTLREVPSEAVIASHQLMLRAGLMRKLGNGLFFYLPLGTRCFRKVEQIIREEMDRIGGLECKPPVVVPGELWRASGRWDSMGAGLLRAKNRLDQELVISPTAEEAFTAIVKDELSSYKQLPLILYQINTKFRDEIRPRYGVMRGREFTMKDAYSFHTDEESLDAVYNDFALAYRRIFKRLGLTVIPVRADSGLIGGTGSEEFMVESEVGDDTLMLCPKCSYAANTEKASCAPDYGAINEEDCTQAPLPAEEVQTPNVKTIEELTAFLNTDPKKFIKTLIYRVDNSETDMSGAPGAQKGATFFVAVCIRGDLDVNEAKLASLLKAGSVELASNGEVERITGAPVGFAGPVGLNTVPVIADETVMHMHDAVVGALKTDVHFRHVEPVRDFVPFIRADVRTVKEGDRCPNCGAVLYSKKGNELGHIFKLGDKYSKSLNAVFLDENGKQRLPLMGCYGIGVDRALASIIEEHHDDNGIVWPMTAAPYQVAVVPVRYEDDMKTAANLLYEALQQKGLETLLDDRNERPGVKFKDMDLLGIPLQIVVGGKNLPKVEVKQRKTGESVLMTPQEAADFAATFVKEALQRLNDCSDIRI